MTSKSSRRVPPAVADGGDASAATAAAARRRRRRNVSPRRPTSPSPPRAELASASVVARAATRARAASARATGVPVLPRRCGPRVNDSHRAHADKLHVVSPSRPRRTPAAATSPRGARRFERRAAHAHAWAPSAPPLVLTRGELAVDRPIARASHARIFSSHRAGRTEFCSARPPPPTPRCAAWTLVPPLLRAALGASSTTRSLPFGERDLERAFPGVLAAHRHWRWADRRRYERLPRAATFRRSPMSQAPGLPPHVWVLQHLAGRGQLAACCGRRAKIARCSRPELGAGPSGRDEADLVDFARNKSAGLAACNYLGSDEVASSCPRSFCSARFHQPPCWRDHPLRGARRSRCARSPWCRVRELRGSRAAGELLHRGQRRACCSTGQRPHADRRPALKSVAGVL